MERIQAEQPDRILLLGDLLYHGPRNDLPRAMLPKGDPHAERLEGEDHRGAGQL